MVAFQETSQTNNSFKSMKNELILVEIQSYIMFLDIDVQKHDYISTGLKTKESKPNIFQQPCLRVGSCQLPIARTANRRSTEQKACSLASLPSILTKKLKKVRPRKFFFKKKNTSPPFMFSWIALRGML